MSKVAIETKPTSCGVCPLRRRMRRKGDGKFDKCTVSGMEIKPHFGHYPEGCRLPLKIEKGAK